MNINVAFRESVIIRQDRMSQRPSGRAPTCLYIRCIPSTNIIMFSYEIFCCSFHYCRYYCL